jgi:NTP pyrophosphatase (non-canonical NTP hydrolase)
MLGYRHREPGMSAGPYSIGSQKWPGLAKLMEECGEVTQVVGKIIAAGGQNIHWDSDVALTARLENEIADVTAAIVFLTETNGLDATRISERANRKLKLFRGWHTENQDPSGVAPS